MFVPGGGQLVDERIASFLDEQTLTRVATVSKQGKALANGEVKRRGFFEDPIARFVHEHCFPNMASTQFTIRLREVRRIGGYQSSLTAYRRFSLTFDRLVPNALPIGLGCTLWGGFVYLVIWAALYRNLSVAAVAHHVRYRHIYLGIPSLVFRGSLLGMLAIGGMAVGREVFTWRHGGYYKRVIVSPRELDELSGRNDLERISRMGLAPKMSIEAAQIIQWVRSQGEREDRKLCWFLSWYREPFKQQSLQTFKQVLDRVDPTKEVPFVGWSPSPEEAFNLSLGVVSRHVERTKHWDRSPLWKRLHAGVTNGLNSAQKRELANGVEGKRIQGLPFGPERDARLRALLNRLRTSRADSLPD